MNTLSRSSTSSSAAGMIPWLLNLATRLLARSLNMPEPLVHTTGVTGVRACGGGRDPPRQDAVPGSPVAPDPELAAPAGPLIPSPSTPAQGELP